MPSLRSDVRNEATILELVVIVIDLGDICQDRDKADWTSNSPKIYHQVYPIKRASKDQAAIIHKYRGQKSLFKKLI